MKYLKKILSIIFVFALVLSAKQLVNAEGVQPEGLLILTIDGQQAPNYRLSTEVVYRDDETRAADGIQFKYYARNAEGNFVYLGTQEVLNTGDQYNLVFETDMWELAEYTKIQIHQVSHLERKTWMPTGRGNNGRMKVHYNTTGGRFKDDSIQKSVTSYRGGRLDLFDGYEEPTRENYTFSHWERSSVQPWDLENDLIPDGIANLTLYAVWTENTKYTVSFDTVGGGVISQITNITPNSLISAPNTPSKEGHSFAGWYKDAKYQEAWDFTEDKVNENITLYAKWNLIPEDVYYSVKFESNGGSLIDTIIVPENSMITEPIKPIRDGHTFMGWYQDSELMNVWKFDSLVNEDVTLYAKWTENVTPENYYTVTFETNGGSNVQEQTVLENEKIIEPNTPVKEGFSFAGWYVDEQLTVSWNFADEINQDMTLYAKWSKNQVTNPEEGEELPGTGLSNNILIPSGFVLITLGAISMLLAKKKENNN